MKPFILALLIVCGGCRDDRKDYVAGYEIGKAAGISETVQRYATSNVYLAPLVITNDFINVSNVTFVSLIPDANGYDMAALGGRYNTMQYCLFITQEAPTNHGGRGKWVWVPEPEDPCGEAAYMKEL